MSAQIDHAIATYRTELEAEAELAKDDLVELEDHMRTLIADLRETGLSSEQAIITAKLRLGDPKALAREHARVRSPFGAKLSRTRAWSAGALFMTLVVLGWAIRPGDFTGWSGHQLAIGVALAIGLFARLSWARAAVAGYVAYNLIDLGLFLVTYDGMWLAPLDWVSYALQLGVLAFVMPWRRGEIGPAGLALALINVLHLASITAIVTLSATSIGPGLGFAAYITALVAAIGIVMRARWAAPLAAASGACLAIAVSAVLATYPHSMFWLIPEAMIAGVLAAAACFAISWRTARTSLGSLRGFAS